MDVVCQTYKVLSNHNYHNSGRLLLSLQSATERSAERGYNRAENSLLHMNDGVFYDTDDLPNTLSNRGEGKGSGQSVRACVNEQTMQPAWHNK